MRVRVRFRFRADTGEVEMFTVEDVSGAVTGADHDRRHDLVTADLARVVERFPLIEEVLPGAATARDTDSGQAAMSENTETPDSTTQDSESRRLRG
jgi:hypothetical protein